MGNYEFEFVMTDDKIRNKILKYMKPQKNSYINDNLNLVYGVCDKKHNVFITLYYYMSQAIMRDGRNANDYTYIVVTPLHTFTVDYTEQLYNENDYSKISISLLDMVNKEIVIEGIKTYENYDLRRKFQKKVEEEINGSLYSLKREAIENLKKSLK